MPTPRSFALLLAAGAALPVLAHDDGRPVPGEIILVTAPGVSLDDVRAAHPGLTLTDIRRFSPARIHLLQVPIGQEEIYEAELAADVLLVQSAEENKTVASPEEGTTQSLFLRSTGAGVREQAAFLSINLPQTGRASAPPGAVVAVLDTGVAPHPDLAGRILPGGYNFITDSSDVAETGCEGAAVGHGTYIAGLISMVDPSAQILPIGVLGCDGAGNAFAVACGIFHAIDMGVGVINMSFATTIESPCVQDALRAAAAARITCVASVSNSARDTGDTPVFPADYDGVIGAAAADLTQGAWAKAPFSDWGKDVTIAAPGQDVYSLWFDGVEFTYARGSGVSYSTAIVAGLCSALRTKYGVHRAEWTMTRLTRSALLADVGFALGNNSRVGPAYILDAARALCPADVNADEFVDFFDYDAFAAAFEAGDPLADFNGDGFQDFFDYDDYLRAFETGC